jgi:predicted ABC-type ATPase
MESNLVSNFSFEIVNDVATKNYSTALYYIGATDLTILNQRIQDRVLLGLHYVSPADVQTRYNEALAKLPSNLKLFDRVSFLDNSSQGPAPTEALRLERGIVVWESPSLPQWLERILPSIRRLSAAYETLKSRPKRDLGLGL